ncbi:protein CASC3 [Protopterus annectens]|uniref:protein CASC3 n=1 Tax=Protopterus annectens TaxID=7888 RepID=UPI001CFA0E76|nr:protein CASC3 [Protopterus annectens]
MADRRRKRASQDSEEDVKSGSSVDSAGSGTEDCPGSVRSSSSSRAYRRPEPEHIKCDEESECESEDGIEGDAILSDYESAEENGSRVSEESAEPVENKAGKKVQKPLDDDEDRKNPAYIPRKGLFFEHDLRGQTQEEEVRPKGHQRKLWKDEERWVHDRFHEDEQAPKSREELIALYGYDIRSEVSPDAIRPHRIRKPRFVNPSRSEQDCLDEKPSRPPRYRAPSSIPQTRPYIGRNSPGPGWTSSTKPFQRTASYKENRTANIKHRDANYQNIDSCTSLGDFKQISKFKVSNEIQENEILSVPESKVTERSRKEEAVSESPAIVAEDTVQLVQDNPVQDKPVEKKSYSRVRRTRTKAGDAGKSADDVPQPDLLAPVPQHVQDTSPPSAVKTRTWEKQGDCDIGRLEHEMTQLNLSAPSWTPGQPSFVQSQELRGIPNQMHMGGVPPQYNRVEDMSVQGGRAKRYSRQRPIPDTPSMHINLMDAAYFDTTQFQGPVYTSSESPVQLPPQSIMVQPEVHFAPHPGLHPHQSPAPLTNPGLYTTVSMPLGQPPPPQQLLAPTYFPTPGVMNFNSPTYTYASGALPPHHQPSTHIYPGTQPQPQVFGGVTYFDTMQQQTQPKPSPPRRTSQPVTVKPPPPEFKVEEVTTGTGKLCKLQPRSDPESKTKVEAEKTVWSTKPRPV